MKDFNSKNQWMELPPIVRLYILLWLLYKGYQVRKGLTLIQLFELAGGIGSHHQDVDLYLETQDALGTKIFNNAIIFNECVIAWDGKEPYDIFFYETTGKVRRAINGHLVSNP